MLTHGDAEHAGGAIAAAELFSPAAIIDSTLRDRSPARRNFHRHLRENVKPKRFAHAGDRIPAGDGAVVTLLHPPAARAARTADDQCIVARLDCGAFRVLLLSDSGAETEAVLLRGDHAALRADILVLGRHAQDIVATAGFLAAVQPRVVILAAPDPFRDGSDEPALRRRLADAGAQIYDQQQCGAVIVTFRGPRSEVRGYLDQRVVRLDPR